jgi:hypothetical protein
MSKNDPAWYDELSRKNRDRVDQTLHFLLMGFIPSIFLTAAPSFAYAWNREFIEQAPIERIEDTARDMKFVMMGAVCGQAIHTAAIAFVITTLLLNQS